MPRWATRARTYEINVETGDRLLICSDGLSGMVSDADIESTPARVRDPQRCASQLVNEAIANGGHDNVTVIVADVSGFAEVRRKKMARKTKFTIALVLVLFAAIVGATAWGTNTYLHNAAYLAEDNGKVAVYRGVPGDVFGLSYSEHVETTDVSVDDLQPGFAERLKDGWRSSSRMWPCAVSRQVPTPLSCPSRLRSRALASRSSRALHPTRRSPTSRLTR